jgi:hypothetical protein
MKRLTLSTSIILLLCLVVSCDYHQNRQKARDGRDVSVSQLPELQNFEMVTIVYGQSSMEHCHYAGATIMLGAFLSEEEALETYVSELEALGWAVKPVKYEDERILIRGTQERIVIRGYPYAKDLKDEDYILAKEVYPTIIFVSLWYYVPQRDGC